MTGQQASGVVTTDELAIEDAGDVGRCMRADARRNNERLVAAAREVFAKCGGGASMEAIAKQAGVGVGTLYRHFPKRIDIVEAVYQTDVDELVCAAEEAVAHNEPWQALVAWLEAFLRYGQVKRTFLNELHEAFDKNPQLKVASWDGLSKPAWPAPIWTGQTSCKSSARCAQVRLSPKPRASASSPCSSTGSVLPARSRSSLRTTLAGGSSASPGQGTPRQTLS
jgi:AcrR family transcriptional regulator